MSSELEIEPRKLFGPWNEGYALDKHKIHSRIVGYNQFNHPEFETIRTQIGESLFRYKYRNDVIQLDPLTDTAIQFITTKWKNEIDLIIPVPPSNSTRIYQPSIEIAKNISLKLKLPCDLNSIFKNKTTEELKNISEKEEKLSIIKDAYEIRESKDLENKNILLFDDLYQTGATAETIANILFHDCKVKSVKFLCITKTGN